MRLALRDIPSGVNQTLGSPPTTGQLELPLRVVNCLSLKARVGTQTFEVAAHYIEPGAVGPSAPVLFRSPLALLALINQRQRHLIGS
jgi:hypothetical protein